LSIANTIKNGFGAGKWREGGVCLFIIFSPVRTSPPMKHVMQRKHKNSTTITKKKNSMSEKSCKVITLNSQFIIMK
jgi:hypothetical protein